MKGRIAPANRMAPPEVEALIAGLDEVQRRDVALTLNDLSGWATLHGQVLRFDSTTGAELPDPVKLIGDFDRRPRRGLPEGWIDLFITAGWLDAVRLSNGWTVWKPTPAGVEMRDQWLPEHLQGAEGLG